jgi:hypothetical protein
MIPTKAIPSISPLSIILSPGLRSVSQLYITIIAEYTQMSSVF